MVLQSAPPSKEFSNVARSYAGKRVVRHVW
jgi:hypothetical protein